jgi:DNA-binding MarR family transcriptional regulator
MKRSSRSARAGNPDGSLGATLDFMRELWAFDHALRVASKGMRARLGVTGPQRLAIRLVGQFPGLSAGDLARLMHVDKSTLTGIIDRLARRALLARRPDPRDARRMRLRLTAAGKRLTRPRACTIEAGVQRALGDMIAADRGAAHRVLGDLTAALHASARRARAGRVP